MSIADKNRRLGLALTGLVVSLFLYSFLVIRHRGSLKDPETLTPAQKILRGL